MFLRAREVTGLILRWEHFEDNISGTSTRFALNFKMQDNSLQKLVDPANPNFESKNGNALSVHYVSLGYTLACGIPTIT